MRGRASTDPLFESRLSREGAVKAGRSPPGGEALTAPGVQLSPAILEPDRRQAVLGAFGLADTADLTIAERELREHADRVGCLDIPSFRFRRMVCCGHSQVGSISCAGLARSGGTRRSASSRPGCVRSGQLAFLSVRQRISTSRRP